jgi:flagellar hook-associated protein 1 FlgK
MATLNATLSIAKTALLANQKAISVASQNIANADTDGYSRQRVQFVAMDAVNVGGLLFGTGVSIASVERVYDAFQAVQLRDSYSQFARYESQESVVKALESLMNDLGGAGLMSYIDGLFNAFQDLANDPSAYAERSILLATAATLTDSFNNIDTYIKQDIVDINKRMVTLVDELNDMASRMADLNRQIALVESDTASANDLRDKRDLLLNDIARIVDITTLEKGTGEIDVFLAGGSFLVMGVETGSVTLSYNDDYPVGYDLISNGVTMTDRITGGKLKGLMEGADYNREILDRLNLLSATMVRDVNIQNRAGYGLDSSTNNDFFSAPQVYTKALATNSGAATVTVATVTALASLTLNDYAIRFFDTSNYTVVNTTTGIVATSGSYTSGNAITFDGLSVTITDGTGTPSGGDVFVVSVTKDAAKNMGVAITDTDKIAAAAAAGTLPGDNTNALALAALKDSTAISGATFSKYYTDMVTDIGLVSSSTSANADAREMIVEQMETQRESISGVSIEEEAIMLVKLQRAYQASAQILRTVDEMFDTLFSIR